MTGDANPASPSYTDEESTDEGHARLKRCRYRLDNGITVNCVTAGAGKPLLLLHGWPQTSYAWRHVIPLLARQYRVIAPDLPGFGDSTKPLTGYDKRTIAGIVHALVRLQGYERISVIGHDVGGQLAYAYAAQWPQEIDHLIFVEAGVPGLGTDDAANPFRGGSWHFGFNMLPDLPEALVQGRERLYLRCLFFRDRIGVYNADAIKEADLDVYETALSQPGGLRGSFGHYRARPQDMIDNRDWSAVKLRVPTLVIGAAQGVGLSWLHTVEAAVERVESRVIEECGHYVPEERPFELVDVLRSYLLGA